MVVSFVEMIPGVGDAIQDEWMPMEASHKTMAVAISTAETSGFEIRVGRSCTGRDQGSSSASGLYSHAPGIKGFICWGQVFQ